MIDFLGYIKVSSFKSFADKVVNKFKRKLNDIAGWLISYVLQPVQKNVKKRVTK